MGIAAYEHVATAGISYADEALGRAGATNGELYRHIAQLVTGDKKAADAIMAVFQVFSSFFAESGDSRRSRRQSTTTSLFAMIRPVKLVLAIHQLCVRPPAPYALSLLPRGPSAIATTTAADDEDGSRGDAVVSPPLLHDMRRYYPYVLAAASPGVLKVILFLPRRYPTQQRHLVHPTPQLIRSIANPPPCQVLGLLPLHASFASDPACIAHVAGLPDEADVLYHKLASDGVYVSGCYVAVVRSTREVTP